jgi:hypothetical protein
MSTSILSAGEPGATRCSEAVTGSDIASKGHADVVFALQFALKHLDALYEMGQVASSLLGDTTDEDAPRSVLMGHGALAMEAIEGVSAALKKLGQKVAA